MHIFVVASAGGGTSVGCCHPVPSGVSSAVHQDHRHLSYQQCTTWCQTHQNPWRPATSHWEAHPQCHWYQTKYCWYIPLWGQGMYLVFWSAMDESWKFLGIWLIIHPLINLYPEYFLMVCSRVTHTYPPPMFLSSTNYPIDSPPYHQSLSKSTPIHLTLRHPFINSLEILSICAQLLSTAISYFSKDFLISQYLLIPLSYTYAFPTSLPCPKTSTLTACLLLPCHYYWNMFQQYTKKYIAPHLTLRITFHSYHYLPQSPNGLFASQQKNLSEGLQGGKMMIRGIFQWWKFWNFCHSSKTSRGNSKTA